MTEQRKRALEALERRFMQTKQEVHTEKSKGVERFTEDTDRIIRNNKFSKADNTVKKPSCVVTTRRDVEVKEPAYFELFHSVDDRLLPSCIEISDKKKKLDSLLHELFLHGDSAQKYAQGSKSMKVESTILLDNYVQKNAMSSRSRAMDKQNFSKLSKGRMSSKQRKKMKTFELPTEFHNFQFFKPMHEKWKSYVMKLLKSAGKDQLAQCFLNADLHGANMLVVHCRITAYVGVHGIVIQETNETFGIITHDNKFRVVPKRLSTFVLQADHWKITLLGNKLLSRS